MIDRLQKKERDQFYTDTGKRLTSMQKQLDELTAFQKQRQARRADRRQSFGGGGAATIGQQAGASGLRISQGGMAPSARRRMHRAG